MSTETINPRLAAAAATEAAAAAGEAWAVKMVANGTVDQLRREAEAPQGDFQANDGPRWTRWTKCPCCSSPVWAVLARDNAWLLTAEQSPPEALPSAPQYVRDFLTAVHDGLPWAVAIARSRASNEPEPAAAPPTATAAAAPVKRNRRLGR